MREKEISEAVMSSNSKTDHDSSLDKKAPREGHGCVKWLLRVTGIVSEDTTVPNWKYIRIMFVALFSSAFSLCFLFPFLPDMVLSMGYKEEQKGYYCGLIASSVFAGRAFGSYFWGWLSDKKGRRPVLLITIAGNGIFSFLFGFSTNIPLAMVLRFLSGLINGTVGTAKTVLYEVSDNSNQALSMSSIGIAWGTGLILGPSVGGFLASPAEKFPLVFAEDGLFGDFAFLLPSAIAGAVCLVAFVIVFFTFEETLKNMDVQIAIDEPCVDAGEKQSFIASCNNSQNLHPDTQSVCRFTDVSSALNFSIENLHYEPAAELSFANIERTRSHVDSEEKYNCDSPQNRQVVSRSRHSECDGDEGTKSRHSECDGELGTKSRHSECDGELGTKSRHSECDGEPDTKSSSINNVQVRLLINSGDDEETIEKKHQEQVPHLSGKEDGSLVNENTSTNAKAGLEGDKYQKVSKNKSVGISVTDVNSLGGSIDGCAKHHLYKHGLLQVVVVESLSQASSGSGGNPFVTRCMQKIRHSKLVALCSKSEVRSSVMMYTLFSFGVIAFDDIFTVWLSTDPGLDGVGFSSSEIGTSLSAVAAPLMFLQILCYPATAKKFGLKWTFIISAMFITIPIQLMPMLHLVYSRKVLLWVMLLGLLIPEKGACNFCFTSISLMVNNSVSPDNAGAVNGIAMTLTAIARTMAPTIAGSIYSWTVSTGIYLGPPFDISFSFVMMGIIMMCSAVQGVFLPSNLDRQHKR